MSNELIKSDDFGQRTMSPAIAIMMDDKLFDRVRIIAGYMSKAEGFTPKHLIGKSEACFAVVTRSLTWKLDPFAVAQSTYSPAPGKVGFEGKLCQAIIENSGKVKGGVTFETYGDWSKVHGKFEVVTNTEGKKYPKITYTDKDETGLGVIARAQVIGEDKPREYKIDLRQAFPRNSTLWATDPLTQLKYRAVRGLGNLAMPGIFMGVPFEEEAYETSHMVDITPKQEELASPKPSTLDEMIKTAQPKTESAPTVAENAPVPFDTGAFTALLDDITTVPTLEGLKYKFDAAVAQFPDAPADLYRRLVAARDTREAELVKVVAKPEMPMFFGKKE